MVTFFDEETESLVAYYILPTIGLNFKTFGVFFKTAKLTKDLSGIVVTLARGCKEPFWENYYYQKDYDLGADTIAIFRVPDFFVNDVKLFAEGKYSQMSTTIKRKICKGSGLVHSKQVDNLIVTDVRLLVLTKSTVLREWLSTQGIVVKPRTELLTLKDKNSIYYD
jgi:hypothetical protein